MYARLIDRKEFIQEGSWQIKNHLVFEVDPSEIKGGLPIHCELGISEYSPDRNKDQNAKYWTIVGDIARMTGSSKTEIHNQLLNDYGEIEKNNGEPIVVVMKDSFEYLRDEDLHLMPTGRTFTDNGICYAVYYKLKNSKNMTKKEFSRLLDGAIYEKEQIL